MRSAFLITADKADGWGCGVDIGQIVSNASPGVAAVVVVLYFYNQMVLKTLAEQTERNAFLQKMIDRYDARLVAAVDAMAKMAAETHALRGKLTEFMLSLEGRLTAMDNRIRGGNGDD